MKKIGKASKVYLKVIFSQGLFALFKLMLFNFGYYKLQGRWILNICVWLCQSLMAEHDLADDSGKSRIRISWAGKNLQRPSKFNSWPFTGHINIPNQGWGHCHRPSDTLPCSCLQLNNSPCSCKGWNRSQWEAAVSRTCSPSCKFPI